MPKREAVLASPLMRPFARHLRHPSLWHLNRRSVARGMAVGFFFAFITPLAQFVFAALAAVPLRANVAVAFVSTLITNPLTFPPVFWAAHELGQFVVGLRPHTVEDVLEPSRSILFTVFDAVGLTALGLVVMAVVAAPLGFVLGRALWRMHICRRWKERRARIAAQASHPAMG